MFKLLVEIISKHTIHIEDTKEYKHYETLLLQHIRLLCDIEPKRVIKELEKGYYPTQECIHICNNKGNKAGVAYLMRLSGDLVMSFGKYNEVLADLYEKIRQSKDTDEFNDNIDSFRENLKTAMDLCTENSKVMTNEEQGEDLWFKLLDQIYSLFMRSSESKDPSNISKQTTKEMSELMQTLLNEMMHYVSFPKLLTRVANDHGELQISSFKEMFKNMLFSYMYQEKILETARNIASNNIVQQFDNLVKLRSKGFPTLQAKCDKCEESIETKNATEVTVYPCGHIYHTSCIEAEIMCYACTYKEISKFGLMGRGVIIRTIFRKGRK